MNALAQSNDQALAIFAHEMREPLASILFAAHWLVGTECDAMTTREMCEIVERQSRYLALMIDDLLEVSRGKDTMRCLRKDWLDLEHRHHERGRDHKFSVSDARPPSDDFRRLQGASA